MGITQESGIQICPDGLLQEIEYMDEYPEFKSLNEIYEDYMNKPKTSAEVKTIWTAAQEAELCRLQNLKKELLGDAEHKLRDYIDSYVGEFRDLSEFLQEHAENIRELLEPFDESSIK